MMYMAGVALVLTPAHFASTNVGATGVTSIRSVLVDDDVVVVGEVVSDDDVVLVDDDVVVVGEMVSDDDVVVSDDDVVLVDEVVLVDDDVVLVDELVSDVVLVEVVSLGVLPVPTHTWLSTNRPFPAWLSR